MVTITSNPSDRKGFVGGSDIAHVLSLDPYGCQRLLWYRKSGIEPDRPFQMSGVMEIGVALEDYVADKVQTLKGWRLIKRSARSDSHHGVHIDREIQKARETPGIAEIKVVGDQTFWKWMRQGVDVGYVLQLQWGMKLWQRDWGAICAWNRDAGGDPYIFEFEYDSDLMARVTGEVDLFWQMVEGGPAPRILEPRDSRCEGCEYGALCREQEWANVEDNGLVQIEEPPDWRKFRQLDAIEKEAEKAKKELRPEIDKAIGDNEVVRIGNEKVISKPQETWRIDVDRLKKEQPELAMKYMYRSLSRPLRVYQIKEKQ